jgi:hypothetical protein
MKIVSEERLAQIAQTLLHPFAPPLDVVSRTPTVEHQYMSLDLIDWSLRFATNAACTGVARLATPLAMAASMGKDYWDQGGKARLISPVPAMVGMAVGWGVGTCGMFVNGAEVVGGIVGANIGVAGTILEFTLEGMQGLAHGVPLPTAIAHAVAAAAAERAYGLAEANGGTPAHQADAIGRSTGVSAPGQLQPLVQRRA